MPPFDKIPGRPDGDVSDSMQSEPDDSAQHDLGAGSDQPDHGGQDAAEPPSAAAGDIPKYDLAENILAEQRRVASRRRRAPTQAEEELPLRPEQGDPVPAFSDTPGEAPSEDLPELQRIVAEIVARDIERLCKRPDI